MMQNLRALMSSNILPPPLTEFRDAYQRYFGHHSSELYSLDGGSSAVDSSVKYTNHSKKTKASTTVWQLLEKYFSAEKITLDRPLRIPLLFQQSINKPSIHTVLVFTTGGKEALTQEAIRATQAYPEDLVQTFVISESPTIDFQVPTFVDRDGNARNAYLTRKNEVDIVVIRPDMFIGAIVVGAEGLARYFNKVLKTI